MKTQTKPYMRGAVPEDDEFRFEVYASTRKKETAAWGWDESVLNPFLRMQFELQQKSYALRFPDARYRIVVWEERRAGHLLFAGTEKDYVLADFALLPECRNRGLGRLLLRMLQEEAGSGSIELQVHKSNPAVRLYTNADFRTVADRDPYWLMAWNPSPILRRGD